MANVMFSPKFAVADSTGAPLASGKVYTYSAGTTTPKDTYADSGAVTPNANPVILDARGEATIYGVGTYKVVVKDSNGNTIYTVDNYAISGTVGTADITDGAVTTAKLASNALSADVTGRGKMQDGYVTSAKLDASGVTLPNGSAASTQATGDSTTKVATTAYVQGEFTDKAATQANMEGQTASKFVTADKVKYAPAACKAWGYIAGSTGTGYPVSLTINASYNVASAAKIAQGTYKVTFTTPFSSANYAVCVMNMDSTGAAIFAVVTALTATDFTCVFQPRTDGAAVANPENFHFVAFGDF